MELAATTCERCVEGGKYSTILQQLHDDGDDGDDD